MRSLSCWLFGHTYSPTLLPASNDYVNVDDNNWAWGLVRECVHCGDRDDRPFEGGKIVSKEEVVG